MTAAKKLYDNEIKGMVIALLDKLKVTRLGYIYQANSYTLPENSNFELGVK
jgi:hypothetical protein